ncbi:MAG: Spy/CpxP family protein refolding chaperone [Ferruginibacter sp.]
MIPSQNKSKILITIIGILLIANIVLVSFFFLQKDERKHDKRMDRKTVIGNFLKDEIGFNEAQMQQYDSMSTWHSKYMKIMFEANRNSKDQQFKELTVADFSDSVMNNIADQSAATQKSMELQMFSHLKNIRALCTPAQQPKFDSLFVKVLNKRGSEGRKKQTEKK